MRDYAKTGGRKGMPARNASRSNAVWHSEAGGPGYRTPSSFRAKVYKIVKSIPKGKTLSYQDVAKRAGSPKAYRAVGNILNKNYDPRIPCHRVIRSDGTLGGYNRGEKKKKEILEKERWSM